MVAGDFRLLLVFVAIVVGALGVLYVVLRAFGYDARRALTTAEWRMALKLLATAIMLYAVVLRAIYVGLPAEKFIYGRF
jgi:hypothetical protein